MSEICTLAETVNSTPHQLRFQQYIHEHTVVHKRATVYLSFIDPERGGFGEIFPEVSRVLKYLGF